MPDITYNQFPISGKIVDFDTLQSDVANLNANAVLESRTINGYDLSENRTIYAQDVPSKNLLPNGLVSRDQYGTTITVNNDGSVTISGTSSADQYLVMATFKRENGVNYILSGAPSGSSANTYCLTLDGAGNDYGSGVSFTGNGGSGSVYIQIKNGAVITTPVTFYPMIRLASITDDTYVQYAKTNVELTKAVSVEDSGITFTPSSGISVRSAGKCFKYGKLIVLAFYFDVTTAKSNNDVIFTAGSALPSPMTQYAIGVGKSLNGNIAELSFEQASPYTQIKAWAQIPVATYYYVQIVYLTSQ